MERVQRVQRVLATLFASPQTMDPDELEDRVEILEQRVEANVIALERHEADLTAHTPSEEVVDK